jgi:hypothetical protein
MEATITMTMMNQGILEFDDLGGETGVVFESSGGGVV